MTANRLPVLIGKIEFCAYTYWVPVGGVDPSGQQAVAGFTATSQATGTLTSDGTNIANNATVTVGDLTYTFKDTPAAAYDVQRDGATAATSLSNLRKAIDGTGSAGTHYFAGTLPNPKVTVTSLTSTVLTLAAAGIGGVGNSVALVGATHLAASGAVMSGGANSAMQVSVASSGSFATTSLSLPDSAVSLAGAAVSITYAAAGPGVSHKFSGITFGYDAAPAAGATLSVVDGAARTVTDGVTATNTALTSATAAFVAADVGRTVSGAGIAVGTRIASVTNGTTTVLDRATTASASGVTVTITPITFVVPVTAAGPGSIAFPKTKGSANSALTITLSAPGGSILGYLNVLGKTTE